MQRYIGDDDVMSPYHQILLLIRRCRYEESNVDRRAELLRGINAALPQSIRIELPSLITNDYISKALDIIEDRLLKKKKAIASLSYSYWPLTFL